MPAQKSEVIPEDRPTDRKHHQALQHEPQGKPTRQEILHKGDQVGHDSDRRKQQRDVGEPLPYADSMRSGLARVSRRITRITTRYTGSATAIAAICHVTMPRKL